MHPCIDPIGVSRITPLPKPHVLIISPALAKANNGNWQTAARWTGFLRPDFKVTCTDWHDGLSKLIKPSLIIALHARRSAAALQEFDRTQPTVPIVLILTGTDLYRDIQNHPDAQAALRIADRLILLQASGLAELTPHLHAKSTVIYQSAASLKPALPSSSRLHFNVIMVGHLRAEKDPATFLRAITLSARTQLRFTHIGAALAPDLGQLAEHTATADHRYRWLGNLPHAATRQRLKHSDLMVISSVMEGGANVIIEAVTSGVPILASDISGNRGLLGDDYAGYFPVGDAAALARLIDRAATDPTWLDRLRAQCRAQAHLFTPQRERAAVRALVDNCLRPAVHTEAALHHSLSKDVQ